MWKGPNVFRELQTHGLMDSWTCTRINFTAGMFCSLPILYVQQLSNEPGTAIGVIVMQY